MRATDISKQMVWDRGFNTPPTAADGIKYNESGREFTEGQLAKVTDAYDKLRERMGTRWKLIEPPAPAKKAKKKK